MPSKGTRGRSAGKAGSGTTPRRKRTRAVKTPPALAPVEATVEVADGNPAAPASEHEIRVRRMHRRDFNRVWEFLKLVFRVVNKQTVEYQRPRSKQRFLEQYDDEGIVQLVFEVGGKIVGYAECAFEVTGSDNWINPRYFDNRDMRPMFVEELASHPDYHGRGIGSFILEQVQHLARLRGCTHLVLEVAENNRNALTFYRKRNFFKLDAAIFMAKKVPTEPELLPPRPLPDPAADASDREPSDEES